MVNMWSRVRHLKRVTGSRSQDSHRVKAGLLQLNPTIPFVDNDAYVVSSDVSLAGYLCTHVCLFYVFAETSVSLVVSRGLRRLACYLSYDLVPRQDW